MSVGKQIKTRKLDRAGWKQVWSQLRNPLAIPRPTRDVLRRTLERQAPGMFGFDPIGARFVAPHAPTAQVMRHEDGQISLLGARERAPGWYWPLHICGDSIAYPHATWRSYARPQPTPTKQAA